MSILIKGMEMPTSCARCRCVRGCKAVNDRIKRLDKEPWLPGDHRHSDCPLVPVPPHGDLIDRDPFVQFIKSHWDSSDQWFVEQLEARPTIIPAEEGKT